MGEEGLVRDASFAANGLSDRLQEKGAATVILILDACRDTADPNDVPEAATLYMKVPPNTRLDAGRAHLCRWHDVANVDLQRAEIAGDSPHLDPQAEFQRARIVLI
jgi:hypothetical protein